MASTGKLCLVQAHHEVEMPAPFLEHGLNLLWIHPRIVPLHIKPRKGCAWRRPNKPSALKGVNEPSGFLPIRGAINVPRAPIGFAGTQI